MNALTAKEREVLLWHARGKTAEECAQILGVSPRTVVNHLASAREKMNAANSTHAILLALKRGFIKLSEVYLLLAVIMAGTATDMDANRTRVRLRQPQVRITRTLAQSESSDRV